MRIQIYIDHDIMIRHFVKSGVLSCLETDHVVEYVFPKEDRRVTVDVHALDLPSVREIPVDRSRIARLRWLCRIVALRRGRRDPLVYETLRTTFRRSARGRAYLRIWLRSLPLINDIYKLHVVRGVGIYQELRDALEDFQPDVVLHPTVLDGLFINDLCSETSARGVRFVALMNSWDNPSTKATVMGQPDTIGVWGEQTRRHAIRFLGVPEASVKILGAAQFDVYREPPELSKSDICDLLGLDPHRDLILYAGSSKSVNEMAHLQQLEMVIAAGHLNDCSVIYRPHPWRSSAPGEPDFEEMNFKHVRMDPTMRDDYAVSIRNPGTVNLSDYRGTHSVLSAADILLSNVSTIMLEGVLHGLPVACMTSDDDLKDNDFLRRIHDSLFFTEFLEALEVPRIKNVADLPTVCRSLLGSRSEAGFREEQERRLSYFVDFAEPAYGQRLLDLVADGS